MAQPLDLSDAPTLQLDLSTDTPPRPLARPIPATPSNEVAGGGVCCGLPALVMRLLGRKDPPSSEPAPDLCDKSGSAHYTSLADFHIREQQDQMFKERMALYRHHQRQEPLPRTPSANDSDVSGFHGKAGLARKSSIRSVSDESDPRGRADSDVDEAGPVYYNSTALNAAGLPRSPERVFAAAAAGVKNGAPPDSPLDHGLVDISAASARQSEAMEGEGADSTGHSNAAGRDHSDSNVGIYVRKDSGRAHSEGKDYSPRLDAMAQPVVLKASTMMLNDALMPVAHSRQTNSAEPAEATGRARSPRHGIKRTSFDGHGSGRVSRERRRSWEMRREHDPPEAAAFASPFNMKVSPSTSFRCSPTRIGTRRSTERQRVDLESPFARQPPASSQGLRSHNQLGMKRGRIPRQVDSSGNIDRISPQLVSAPVAVEHNAVGVEVPFALPPPSHTEAAASVEPRAASSGPPTGPVSTVEVLPSNRSTGSLAVDASGDNASPDKDAPKTRGKQAVDAARISRAPDAPIAPFTSDFGRAWSDDVEDRQPPAAVGTQAARIQAGDQQSASAASIAER